MNLKPFIASVAAGAILAGGAFALAAMSFIGAAKDEAIELVPDNAVVYGSIFLEPSIDQKLALEDLLANFPQAATPTAAAEAIAELLDQGLNEIGLSFATDIEPWLGEQIAFFFTAPGLAVAPAGAALIGSDDPDATQAAIEKAVASAPQPLTSASHNGSDYFTSGPDGLALGVIDDFMVFGTEAGFKAVADSEGSGSLGDSEIYSDAFDGLTGDRLATFYFDPRSLMTGMAAMAPPGMLQGGFGMGAGPTGAVLFARGDGVVVETGSPLPVGGKERGLFADLASGTDLIERLPSTAWGAFGTPNFGQVLTLALDQLAGSGLPGISTQVVADQFRAETDLDLFRLLSWIGDVAVFIEGSSPDALAGGVVMRSTDPEGTAAAMEPIAAALARNGVPIKPLGLGAFQGFRIQDRAMPDAIHVIAADERVLIVYGRGATLAALGSDPTLGSTDSFTRALGSLGEGLTVSAYADMKTIVSLIEGALPGDEVYESKVRPFLEPLTHFVVGSKIEGDRTIARLVIGVR